MKAKDLMIGDWVRIMQPKDFHGNERRLQVTEISEADDSICYFSGDAGGELTISTRHLEPIPLTCEILEMNGWRQYGPYFSNDNADFELDPYRVGGFGIRVSADEYGSGTFACIKYVHQLQHALRLCGIKKEIEL